MKTLTSLASCALALAGVCSTPAGASSLAPRAETIVPVKAGDSVTFMDGVFTVKCNRWEVKEVDNGSGQTVIACGENTNFLTTDARNPVKAVNGQGKTVASFTPFYPELSFPLHVGKKWTGQYKGQKGWERWTGDVACEAAAFESVTTKAGTVEAFRINCVDNWDAGIIFLNGTAKSTRWYAPSLGLIVKSVHEDSDWNYEIAARN